MILAAVICDALNHPPLLLLVSRHHCPTRHVLLNLLGALLNKAPSREALPSGDCQKPGELGFHPASNTEQMVAEIGPVSLIPATGVSSQHGGLFPPKSADSASRVNITISPHCDPLANLLNPGSGLWYSLDSEKPCDCGDWCMLGSFPKPCPTSDFGTWRRPVRWMLPALCDL